MSYTLGPVVGQVGGQMESITEEVTVPSDQPREWFLPEGWETGVILGTGGISRGYWSAGIRVFDTNINLGNTQPRQESVSGVGELSRDTPSIISSGNPTWSGTVTLIRTS